MRKIIYINKFRKLRKFKQYIKVYIFHVHFVCDINKSIKEDYKISDCDHY